MYIMLYPDLSVPYIWVTPFTSKQLKQNPDMDHKKTWWVLKFQRNKPWHDMNHESHEKNPNLLSIESWMVNRDPYNGLL